MQTVQATAAKTPGIAEGEPLKLLIRIGSTVYTANAYFSAETSETLADKILRLARNDGLDFQSEQAQKPLRTGRSQKGAQYEQY